MRKASEADIHAFGEAALRNPAETNRYSGFESLIAASKTGSVYISENPAGVFILRDAGNFYRLYFVFTGSAAEHAPSFDTDKPITAEIPFRGSIPESAGFLIDCGFSAALNRTRMSLSIKNENTLIYTGTPRFSAEDIRGLFSASFDELTGCVPDSCEIESALSEGRVITSSSGSVLEGALFYENAGNISVIHNIAVSSKARGRGIASAMLNELLSRLHRKQILRLWVDDGNTAAIKLYENAGLKPDGMKSQVLIKEL